MEFPPLAFPDDFELLDEDLLDFPGLDLPFMDFPPSDTDDEELTHLCLRRQCGACGRRFKYEDPLVARKR